MGEQVLRLRRRRDGSLALTGPDGNVEDPDRAFPAEFTFTFEWMANNPGAVAVDGDTLTVSLANGTATYTVEERTPQGYRVTLASSDLTDAPPIDEKRAAALAAAREDG